MDARAARSRRRQVAQQRLQVQNEGNPENPAVPLDPDAWEERGWLTRSDAGVRMSHKQALGHPPILRGINLIVNGVSKLPRNVHRLDADHKPQGIEWQHAAQSLLNRKANAQLRSHTWIKSMLYHAVFRGNGYSAIFRKGRIPTDLVLLDPIQTGPVIIDGELWYLTEVAGQKKRIPAADVFHLKGLSFDGLEGHDVLSLMANALALGPAARKWMSKLLARGSTAGGLLQLPRELSPDARKKRQEEFDKYQSGLDNAFKTLALEDGAKWIRTMITPEEAAIFSVLNFDVKSVANVLGLPPHKLGDESKSSHNSLEQENKAYLEDTLDPWCIEIETEAQEKLLSDAEDANYSHAVIIDRTQMQLPDLQSQANAFCKLTNEGLMLPDTACAKMNLPPLPNGQGKKLRIPVNIAVDGVIAGQASGGREPTGSANPEPKNQPVDTGRSPDAAMQNAARELLADRLRRMEKIAADQLPKATNKGPEAVADFWRHHTERLHDALAPVVPVVALANGLPESIHTADEIATQVRAVRSLDEQLAIVIQLVTTKQGSADDQ